MEKDSGKSIGYEEFIVQMVEALGKTKP